MELGLKRANNVTHIYPCKKLEDSPYIIDASPSVTCILYIFLALLSFIAVCGNLLVIISIAYFKQLQTHTNYLILSLAVTDLLVGLLVFPLAMAFSLNTCVCHQLFFCKIRAFLDASFSISSNLHMYCISIDRYYAVCKPLTYKRKITHNVVLTMILLIWGVSFSGGISVTVATLFNLRCEGMCVIVTLITTSIGVFLSFYLPVILTVCIYFKILIVARKHACNIQNTKTGGSSSNTGRKTIKTMATVLGAYCIFLTPLAVWTSIMPFTPHSPPVTEALTWLELSNSLINPFIYAFFYSWFRTAFRMIICGKIFKGNFANTKLT